MSHPCLHCGTIYPHDAEHFHYHKRDGLTHVCKDCHKAQRRHDAKKASLKRKAQLKAIESAGVSLYAKLAGAGGSNIPHSAELVEKVCEYFGGVAGFASIVVKQYYDAKPGTSARNKVIETICRLIQNNVDNGGAKKPLSLWTEDELEAELQDRFRLAVLSQRRVIDATPTSEGDAASSDPASGGDDAASGGSDQADPVRVAGTPAGGAEALQADAVAGEGPRMQGE